MQFYALARDKYIKLGWEALWKAFVCPPVGKVCSIRQSCLKKPTYLSAWLKLRLDPVGLEHRWVVYMTIGHKIKCVEEGPGTDDVPEIPELMELPPDEIPEQEKGTGNVSQEGHEKSEETAAKFAPTTKPASEEETGKPSAKSKPRLF